MGRLSRVLSFLLSLAVVTFAVACVVHFIAIDTIALHRLADDTICIGQRSPCVPVFTLLERNALGVSVAYDAPSKGVVQCRRRYLVVGDYACVILPSTVAEHVPLVAPLPRPSARPATRP